jgi:hypothetical protein
VEIALADFFLTPTVAHLATIVDTTRAAQLSDKDLLDLVEGLSDDEVARMVSDLGDRS